MWRTEPQVPVSEATPACGLCPEATELVTQIGFLTVIWGLCGAYFGGLVSISGEAFHVVHCCCEGDAAALKGSV